MHAFEQGDSHIQQQDSISAANLFEETSTNHTNHSDYMNTTDSSSHVLPDFELIDKDTNLASEQNNIGLSGQGGQANQGQVKDAASEFALENFEDMDADDNGYLSNAELEDYGNKNSLTSEEQELMTVLKDNNEEWQKRSDDEYFFENNGVSKTDLARPLIGKEIENIVENHFQEIDSDQDGLIEKDEIENYTNETKPGNKEQEALKWLSAIAEITSPSITSALNPFATKGLNKEQAQAIGETSTDFWKSE